MQENSLSMTHGVDEPNGVHTFDVEVLDELLLLFGSVFTRRLGYLHVDKASSGSDWASWSCSALIGVLDALETVLLDVLNGEQTLGAFEEGVDHVTGYYCSSSSKPRLYFLTTTMQTLTRNATISQLALIVAGRRVVQPFHARTLRVSLSARVEPVTDLPTPLDVPQPPIPKAPKKRSKTPPPSSKPKGKKSSPEAQKKAKSKQSLAKDPKGPKSTCKTKGAKVPQERVSDGGGFVTDWGRDGTFPCSIS